MILSLDGGLETFGWAIVHPRSARVVALGELYQKPNAKLHGKHADRQLRAAAQARLLSSLIVAHGVRTIAAEALSIPSPSTNAVAAIMISAGAVVTAAVIYGCALVVVEPKQWQRAVLGIEDGAVDYAIVEQKLADFIIGAPREQLLAIPRGRRNHPLDASAVGIYAAVREPSDVTYILQGAA